MEKLKMMFDLSQKYGENTFKNMDVHADEENVRIYHGEGYCIDLKRQEGGIIFLSETHDGFTPVEENEFWPLFLKDVIEMLEHKENSYRQRAKMEVQETGIGGVEKSEGFYEMTAMADKLANEIFELDKLI